MTDDLDSQFTDSWGVALMQGKRPYMEDTYSTYFSSSGISYFGVYDGHGNDHVSKYLASNLLGNVHDSFMNQNGSLKERIEKSLKESFMKRKIDLIGEVEEVQVLLQQFIKMKIINIE